MTGSSKIQKQEPHADAAAQQSHQRPHVFTIFGGIARAAADRALPPECFFFCYQHQQQDSEARATCRRSSTAEPPATTCFHHLWRYCTGGRRPRAPPGVFFFLLSAPAARFRSKSHMQTQQHSRATSDHMFSPSLAVLHGRPQTARSPRSFFFCYQHQQ